MKFRGVITEMAAMREFMNVAMSLSKISKDCVMRMTLSKLYFIVSDEEGGPKQPLVWCELPVSYYFREYNLSGVSDEHNEIYLEFASAMLARSLVTVKQNAKSLKIRLTDKQTPCITLDVELASTDSTQSRRCVHDIPVEVIHKKHWENYAEPEFTEFHVSIQMPPLKPVKSIVERMKSMSHNLIVSANKNGRLILQIKTNMATISSHFTDLSIISFAVGQIPTLDDLQTVDEGLDTVTATIDIKKFLMFLTGMQTSNCRVMCSIVQGRMVKLFLEQPGIISWQIFLTELSL